MKMECQNCYHGDFRETFAPGYFCKLTGIKYWIAKMMAWNKDFCMCPWFLQRFAANQSKETGRIMP